jgi:hypothetical protein
MTYGVTPNIQKQRWPNLFIIGAMKSGSTSLHRYLNRHPEIFLSDPKEPGYFVPEMNYYPKDESWYLGLFGEAGDVRYIGESSTHYTKQRRFMNVPERIARHCPDARFVYIMRDPVERTISHYWHNVRWEGETQDIQKALLKNPDYLEFSDYALQLEPYIRCFGSDRICSLTFESLVADPEAVLGSILTWLDLEPRLEMGEGGLAYNVTPRSMRKAKGFGLLYRFRRSGVWGRLSPLTPRVLKKIGNRFTEAQVEKSVTHYEIIEYIKTMLTPRVCVLRDMTSIDTGVWKNFSLS